MTESATTTDSRTGSADYSAAYYFDGHLGPPYTYEEPHWRQFFGAVADVVVATFSPQTTYDAGCAIGLFVRSLVERGVDARGGDISRFAVEGAPDGLRERLEVRDLSQPFTERYDFISCIEVLEHMSSGDAQVAIRNLCAATDTILLSSTPDDFVEPTHVNVRPSASWAQDFARQGFFRRTDVDASFLSPWAVVFSRGTRTAVDAVSSYESLLAPLWREVVAKRQALLETQRDLDQARGATVEQQARVQGEIEEIRAERDQALASRDRIAQDRDRLHDELTVARGDGTPQEQLVRLALVDELIGLKAELVQARIRADNATIDAVRAASAELGLVRADLDLTKKALHEEVLDHRRSLEDMRGSATWRVGSRALLPMRVARRLRVK